MGGVVMAKAFLYDVGTKNVDITENNQDIKDNAKNKNKRIWVDISTNNSEEIKLLQDAFHFHPIAVESATNEGERPKFYDYGNYSLLLMQVAIPSNKGSTAKFSQFTAFISQDSLVTVHPIEFNFVADTIKIYKDAPELFDKGIGFVLYHLLDGLISNYFSILDKVDNRLKSVEENIFQKPDKHVLNEIFKLRQGINQVRKSISNNLDVLSLLLRHDASDTSDENRLYYMDLYDHLMHLLDMTDMYHDMVFTSMDAYLSSVSNNMNNVMKVLTVITTIMMPLTVITGIYGMNFDIPSFHWRFGYIWALGLMVISCIAMAWFLRSRNWL
jgi:magnesium transporter